MDDLDAYDLPDLIGAMAERFAERGIGPRQAVFIAATMLAAEFDDASDDFDLESIH